MDAQAWITDRRREAMREDLPARLVVDRETYDKLMAYTRHTNDLLGIDGPPTSLVFRGVPIVVGE